MILLFPWCPPESCTIFRTLFDGVIRDISTSFVTVRLRGFEDDSGALQNEAFSTETSLFDFDSAISEQRTLTQTSDDGNLETVLTITVSRV